MGQIELSAAIRRTPEDIFQFLSDFRNHGAFLTSERFRNYHCPGEADRPATRMQIELRALKRWWALDFTFAEQTASSRLVQSSEGPMKVRLTWTLDPMRPDRRGSRTAVTLQVDYKIPGGPLAGLADRALLNGRMLKAFDPVIRQLPIQLEGPPRSGLKTEEP